MPDERLSAELARHYAPPAGDEDLTSRILAVLERAGKNTEPLAPDDLAAVDEFHVRGRDATRELARVAGITSAQHVLDAGSGLGGPARRLAHEFGCRVTGVDLTYAYCRAAAELSARTGLAPRLDFVCADAYRLPFGAAAFDVAWSQHAAMNIPDKPALYRELYRVLRPGGALALYDVLAGPGGTPLCPVPWAGSAETSFLLTPEELRGLLEDTGFTVASWSDTTAEAEAWFARQAARAATPSSKSAAAAPTLGLHTLFGAAWGEMLKNLRRNIAERRVLLIEAIARR